MSLLTMCQWIQETALSAALRESTWGFPILGAVHVLAIAWFGGALFVPDLRAWRWTGIVALLVTGALLFWVEPLKCYHSISFQVKLALLLVIALNAWLRQGARTRLASMVSLLLWAAVIFAARGIAFF